MRKTLIRIVFDDLWRFDWQTDLVWVGAGYFAIVWWLYLAVWGWRSFRANGVASGIAASLLAGLIGPVVIGVLLPEWNPALSTAGIPVFGYGFMLFVGFVAGMMFAARRAVRVGIAQETVWDLGMWILVPGILGARLFYLVQYGDRMFAGKSGVALIKTAIDLSQGGLVFYGGVISGIIGYLFYCHRRQLSPLLIADITIPSIFFGLGFGRLGCLLYGCCYGDACDLPWAIRFPPDSVPYIALSERGLVAMDAVSTIPLHPTQVYSSVNAFVIAILLSAYFRRRPWNGSVLALGWVIYPVTRFVLEILRGDEPGRFNTPLTISQWVSLGMFISGLCFLAIMLYAQRQGASSASTARSTA